MIPLHKAEFQMNHVSKTLYTNNYRGMSQALRRNQSTRICTAVYTPDILLQNVYLRPMYVYYTEVYPICRVVQLAELLQ